MVKTLYFLQQTSYALLILIGTVQVVFRLAKKYSLTPLENKWGLQPNVLTHLWSEPLDEPVAGHELVNAQMFQNKLKSKHTAIRYCTYISQAIRIKVNLAGKTEIRMRITCLQSNGSNSSALQCFELAV